MSLFNKKQKFCDDILEHVLSSNHFREYILMLPLYNSNNPKLHYNEFNVLTSIHNYHRKHPNEHIDKKYYDTLSQIARTGYGERGVKGVLDNVKSQLYFEKNGKAAFHVDCQEILKELKSTIMAHKDIYMGESEISKGPFWNTIQDYNQELSEEYGHKVL